jgi:hypothetical protein
MSLDGQVLVIACFAVALNLLVWAGEDNVVGLGVELDPKDVLHLDERAAAWSGTAARRS